MDFGWKFLLPAAILNIFMTATFCISLLSTRFLRDADTSFHPLRRHGDWLRDRDGRASNPLYSAISLIGVFISLASIYVMLAAPFIAAVQVIVYAGAIMVLVIFVIMLLNVEQEEPRRKRLKFLVPMAIGMAAILIAETVFILHSVQTTENQLAGNISDVGLTHSIGSGLFTRYLLPFE